MARVVRVGTVAPDVLAVLHQPLLGRWGRKVVAGLCTWEVVALVPGSPVPTISATVDRHPWFGLLLLALLTHHWYVETGERVLIGGSTSAPGVEVTLVA